MLLVAIYENDPEGGIRLLSGSADPEVIYQVSGIMQSALDRVDEKITQPILKIVPGGNREERL